jgi:hypothetical protein
VKRAAEFSPAIQRDQKRPRGATSYYGQFSLVEQLGDTGDANAGRWLVDLDCFTAQWFDGLRADLGNLPSWRTVAQQAGSLIVEFTQPEAALLQMLVPALGPVASAADLTASWLSLELVIDRGRADGLLPVDVYLPPPGGIDPTLIAGAGQSAPGGRLLSVSPSGPGAAKLALLDAMLAPQG